MFGLKAFGEVFKCSVAAAASAVEEAIGRLV